jgi:hypothetical protein
MQEQSPTRTMSSFGKATSARSPGSPPKARKARIDFSANDEALLARHLSCYPPEERKKGYVFKEFTTKVGLSLPAQLPSYL